jgi:ketosteroid isomerase-like protein
MSGHDLDLAHEVAVLRARVERLEAREACISTFNEYLHHLDGDRLEELLQVFAPDAELNVMNFPPGSGKNLHFKGRDEIRPLYEAHHAGIGRHHSANITVNVEGDEAELSAYFITSGAYAFGGGLYQLELRAYPGKWLIQRMYICSTWGWRIPHDEPPYLAEHLGAGALRGGRPVVYRLS